ncbi:hypothetical protein BC489_01830 [Neisseria meningitidis]|nr:hypothetical protein BC489_01830 [Neisseria meningitidis]
MAIYDLNEIAVGRILESDIFQQRHFGNDRCVKYFCRIQISDLESDIFQQRHFGNDRCVKYFCRIQISDLHLCAANFTRY